MVPYALYMASTLKAGELVEATQLKYSIHAIDNRQDYINIVLLLFESFCPLDGTLRGQNSRLLSSRHLLLPV